MHDDQNSSPIRSQIVVLFVDISDSSRLYRELGDTRASALVSDLLTRLAVSVGNEGGEVIDQIGDELMCTFPNSTAAIRSALDMQLQTAKFERSETDHHGIAIRIGLHSGEGFEQDGKPVGDTVYIAKRLTDQAKAGEILLSEPAMAAYDEGEVGFRFIEHARLKGQIIPTAIYEVFLDTTDATESIQNELANRLSSAVSLELLTPQNIRLQVHRGETVTIGRVAPAVLVVEHTTVSRLHARIDERKGRFVLTDVSTNGTYVKDFAHADPHYVRRDEFTLIGLGMIGLGSAPSPDAPNTLQYHCITK